MTTQQNDYNLVVIGSGPAGQKAALWAAKLHKKVAIVDRQSPAGEVGTGSGTIASKTLREAVLSSRRQRTFYGSSDGVRFHVEMVDLTSRLNEVLKSEAEALKSELKRNLVDRLEGEAAFVDTHTVQVQNNRGSKLVSADNFLIAVGARPSKDDKFQADGKRVFSSDDLLSLRELPDDLIIAGAGLIGIEYASLLAALGVKVTLVDQRSDIISSFDRAVIDNFCSQLQQLGVTLRLGESIVECQVDSNPKCVLVKLESGDEIRGEGLLYTAEREGNTDRLNLASAGLHTIKGGKLEVNDHFRTIVPNIYAAGDVIGSPGEDLYYGSISMEQGKLATCHMFGYPVASKPEFFPYAVYAIPEMSMVGKTEQDLKREKVSYEVGIAHYAELAKGRILGDHRGFLKLLFDPDSLRILGVHIIGESAAEIIHIGQTALSFGATLDYFRDNVFNYPTLAEAYKAASLDGLTKVVYTLP